MDAPAIQDLGKTEQYLTFFLNNQEYGVDILRVQEIKGWDSVTEIPNTPSYIKGVINLRGSIVPIIDLRERFSLPSIPYGPTTVVVVLRVVRVDRSCIMGLVVDAVSDVYSINSGGTSPPPDLGGVIDVTFVKGLATVDKKMVIVLDIDRLLGGDLDVVDAHTAALKSTKGE